MADATDIDGEGASEAQNAANSDTQLGLTPKRAKKKRGLPKPTWAEVLELRDELKPFYQELRTQQEVDDGYFNLAYTVRVPQQFKAVIPPTPFILVMDGADHVAADLPRVHVPQRKQTQKAEDEAQLMAKWLNAFWSRAASIEMFNPLRTMAIHGFLRGQAFPKLLFNPDNWPDPSLGRQEDENEAEYQDRLDEANALKRNGFPFLLTGRDPMTILPDPSTDGQLYIIETFERYAADVKKAWPEWDMTDDNGKKIKATDRVEWTEYWDREWKVFGVNGSVVMKPIKHGYGFIPYYAGASGYGNPTGKPHQRFRSILYAVRSLIDAEARRHTHLDAIIGQVAFPYVFKHDDIQLNTQLGGVTDIPADRKFSDAVGFIRPDINIQPVLEEINLLHHAIERATFPDTIKGEKPTGVTAGYPIAILNGQGRVKFRPTLFMMKRASEWVNRGVLQLVENKIGEKVPMYSAEKFNSVDVTLGPDDIRGYYANSVDITPSLPQDEAADIANGIKLFTTGGISLQDLVQTYGHRENADDLIKQRMVEDILKSPQVFPQIAAKVAAAWGVQLPQGAPLDITQSLVPGRATSVGAGGPMTATPNLATPIQTRPGAGVSGQPTPPAQPGSAEHQALMVKGLVHSAMPGGQATGAPTGNGIG